jgi:acyl-CoA-dependent ceramide synthase
MYQSPYWSDYSQFWIGYPNHKLSSSFKTYYLVQLAFWIQQLFVVHIEKPRKDYAQYVVHHLVTCTLIISSYLTNFTRIGHAVLVTMDVADIFLCSAKCFNYAKWKKLCDSLFIVFVAVWIYSRHYEYNRIVYSVYSDFQKYLPLRWDPALGYFSTKLSNWFFIILLGSLQVLLVFWLYLIFRVVAKVVKGSALADNRSDDEDSEAE